MKGTELMDCSFTTLANKSKLNGKSEYTSANNMKIKPIFLIKKSGKLQKKPPWLGSISRSISVTYGPLDQR
jgi:hypothetical protein